MLHFEKMKMAGACESTRSNQGRQRSLIQPLLQAYRQEQPVAQTRTQLTPVRCWTQDFQDLGGGLDADGERAGT